MNTQEIKIYSRVKKIGTFIMQDGQVCAHQWEFGPERYEPGYTMLDLIEIYANSKVEKLIEFKSGNNLDK